MVVTPAGDIFVSDGYGNSRIVHFDKQESSSSPGKPGTGPGEFSIAHSVVVDFEGGSTSPIATTSASRCSSKAEISSPVAQPAVPFGLFMTADDEIWACGSSPTAWRKTDQTLGVPFKDHLVMKFDTSGRVLQLWTLPKGEDGKERPGEVNLLHGIAADADGNDRISATSAASGCRSSSGRSKTRRVRWDEVSSTNWIQPSSISESRRGIPRRA